MASGHWGCASSFPNGRQSGAPRFQRETTCGPRNRRLSTNCPRSRPRVSASTFSDDWQAAPSSRGQSLLVPHSSWPAIRQRQRKMLDCRRVLLLATKLRATLCTAHAYPWNSSVKLVFSNKNHARWHGGRLTASHRPNPGDKAPLAEWGDLVRPERFELPTCCSGGNRSIHLSYGRAPTFTVYMGGRKGINVNVST